MFVQVIQGQVSRCCRGPAGVRPVGRRSWRRARPAGSARPRGVTADGQSIARRPVRVRGRRPAQQRPARAGRVVGTDREAVHRRADVPGQHRGRRRHRRRPGPGRLRAGHPGPHQRPGAGPRADVAGRGAWAGFRPDILGSLGIGHEDGEYTDGPVLHLGGRRPRGRAQGGAARAAGSRWRRWASSRSASPPSSTSRRRGCNSPALTQRRRVQQPGGQPRRLKVVRSSPSSLTDCPIGVPSGDRLVVLVVDPRQRAQRGRARQCVLARVGAAARVAVVAHRPASSRTAPRRAVLARCRHRRPAGRAGTSPGPDEPACAIVIPWG